MAPAVMDLDNRSGAVGSAVAILAIAWLLASGAVVAMNGDEALRMSQPQPLSPISWVPVETDPIPVELPADLLFASRIEPLTGGTVDQRTRFEPGEPVAFTAWLGVPAEVIQVDVELRRLSLNGAQDELLGERQFEIDPDLSFVAGELPAEMLADTDPGTYRLDLFRDDERLAYGAFQIGAVAPNEVDLFAAPRTVTFAIGTHTGIRFDETGARVDELTGAVQSAARAHAEAVAVAVYGDREYLLISSGTWAGYWVPASDSVRLAAEPEDPTAA